MNVLYEDNSILICEKPVGVLSEDDGTDHNVASLAAIQCGCRCTAVHRLDAGTGGAMVLAKTTRAAAAMSQMIQAKEFHKEYLAVIRGEPESCSGQMQDLLYRDAKKNKSYVVTRQRRGVKEALLDYELLDTAADGTGNTFSLVKIRLHTGRTHQIRVQFASRGMPLVGDRKYGSRDSAENPALWSCSISFIHPFTGEPIHVSSLPEQKYPWTLFSEEALR